MSTQNHHQWRRRRRPKKRKILFKGIVFLGQAAAFVVRLWLFDRE